MPYIKVKTEADDKPIDLYYEDMGKGRPVVLIHGWPLSSKMWEYQLSALIDNGYRVITYDRRGFGKSEKPWNGYDYDTMAADLRAVIQELNLKNATLVGFSMGGGEVARYFGRYGSEGITQAVLLGAVTPFMLQTEEHEGVDKEVFEEMIENIKKDRPGFLDEFGKKFFGADMLKDAISESSLEFYRNVASYASGHATVECVKAFAYTDFREDLKKMDVPTLIIHGKEDQTVPIEVSGDLSSKMIKNARYEKYDHAPHGFWFTHKEKLSNDLLSFMKEYTKEETFAG